MLYQRSLKAPQVAPTLAREGTEISASGSPEDFARFIAEDARLWSRLVKATPSLFDRYRERLYVLLEPMRMYGRPEVWPASWPRDLGFVTDSSDIQTNIVRTDGSDAARLEIRCIECQIIGSGRDRFGELIRRLEVAFVDRSDHLFDGRAGLLDELGEARVVHRLERELTSPRRGHHRDPGLQALVRSGEHLVVVGTHDGRDGRW